MCGRFVSATPPDELARYFRARWDAETLVTPDWNVAPTRMVATVIEDDDGRRLTTARWGLVPSWADDPSIGSRLINARSETASAKPAFRSAFRRRRCLVPADGFYEWTAPAGGSRRRQPWYLHRDDGEPLALAGLWEPGRDRGEGRSTPRTCTVLTTDANDAVAAVHDRMPVILPPSAWARWLDPTVDDAEELTGLCRPAPPSLLVWHPVSTEVNDARRNGPHLVAPVEWPGDGAP